MRTHCLLRVLRVLAGRRHAQTLEKCPAEVRARGGCIAVLDRVALLSQELECQVRQVSDEELAATGAGPTLLSA